MADTAERRPRQEGGAQDDAHGGAVVNVIVTNTTGTGTTAAADMRRRRAASWGLPPLASGHRDPLDGLAGLPITDHSDRCRGMFGGGGKWQPCCCGAAWPR